MISVLLQSFLIVALFSETMAQLYFVTPPQGGAKVSFPENREVGTALYTLQAGDSEGNMPTYTVLNSTCESTTPSPTQVPPFPINSFDQLVVPTGGLDAESCTHYTFTFRVSAGGFTLNSGPLTILVTDINDNPPTFDKSSYIGNVWKNDGQGQIVNDEYIIATDPDVLKLPVTLSISGAQTTFAIYQNGSVYVNDSSGLATLGSLTILTIQASDGGLTSIAPLSIILHDQPQSCQCEHGGSCLSLGIGHVCVYAPDPSSATCTFHYDPCKAAPCQNNGTCSKNNGTYSCSCLGSYVGKHCESVDYCDHDNCRHGSTCINLPHSYLCSCRPGYVGEHCTVVNYCHQTHCQHGGTCVNLPNGYMCNYLSTTHEANTTFHLSPVG